MDRVEDETDPMTARAQKALVQGGQAASSGVLYWSWFSVAGWFLLLLFLLVSAVPAMADVLSFEQKAEVCAIVHAANQDGYSGRALLSQLYGGPAAAGVMAEIKELCPRVY